MLLERFFVDPREKGRETKMVILIIQITRTIIIADAVLDRVLGAFRALSLLVLRPLLHAEHQNGEVN